MSGLLCCRRRRSDMGAALSQPQEGVGAGSACGPQSAPLTMAEVIRERKKKAGGAGLGTLRRRLAAAAVRRPRDNRPDRGCSHARFIRSLVSGWRPAEVGALHEEWEAASALRDLVTQAELAREPAPTLPSDLGALLNDRWLCDAELLLRGNIFPIHRAVLSARCPYFRNLLASYPNISARISVDGTGPHVGHEELSAVIRAMYIGDDVSHSQPSLCYTYATANETEWCGNSRESRGWCRGCARQPTCPICAKSNSGGGASDCCPRTNDLDIISSDRTHSWRSCGRSCGRRVDGAQLKRLAEEFGFQLDTLYRDMRYLLDSGEFSDASLVFSWEGGGGSNSSGTRGSDYGFRPELELPCHRAVLAARSRFFRSVMSRRGGNHGNTEGRRGWSPPTVLRVCVDEKVLPRRFARALLHAAYTDQVELSLITRGSSSPQSNGNGSGATSGTANGNKTSSWGRTSSHLDDAFEFYEIARFLEMPIVVQGCEDAIVEALSGETLPHVLRWSSAPHASKWVHRQAMRYLRDEFSTLCGGNGGGGMGGGGAICRLPRSALAEALASPFLQATEVTALRALLRWGERAAQQAQEQREPNVVWHTAHSVSRRGARRREVSDGALREAIAPLVQHLRLEHLPPDNEMLQQAIRRGLVPQPPTQMVEGGSSADAWLGRGPYRPPRLFLPYLDEIKALLEDQTVSASEVARVRRNRYLHRIPDTLYMVHAERNGGDVAASGTLSGGENGTEGACVSDRVLRALRARVRELRASPPAARALSLPTSDSKHVHKQICLRAVRELSLPDACADLLADQHDEDNTATSNSNVNSVQPDGDASELRQRHNGNRNWPRDGVEVEPDGEANDDTERWEDASSDEDCCRYTPTLLESSGEELERERNERRLKRSKPVNDHRPQHIPHESPSTYDNDNSRNSNSGPSGSRRELPSIIAEGHHLRWGGGSGALDGNPGSSNGGVGGGGSGGLPRLSEAVPDVAMCRASPSASAGSTPNANTHLLSTRDYFRHVFTPWAEYGGACLQLDLGDGATHAPRPGSRAQRAGVSGGGSSTNGRIQREPTLVQTQPTRTRPPSGGGVGSSSVPNPPSAQASAPRIQIPPPNADTDADIRAAVELSVIRAYSSFHPRSMSPSIGHPLLTARPYILQHQHHHQSATLPHPSHHYPVYHSAPVQRATPSPSGYLSVSSNGSVGGGATSEQRRTPSPRHLRRHDYTHYRHHPDFRVEGGFGGSHSGSRGQSPNSYA